MSFDNPPPEEICALLRRVRTVAVVGLSPRPARPSHRIAAGLQRHGYRIIPVRPLVGEVLGEKAYPDLASLPEPPDLVNVFRSADHLPALVSECLRLGIGSLWAQEGIRDDPSAQRAKAAGMTVVMDRCILRDLRTLCE